MDVACLTQSTRPMSSLHRLVNHDDAPPVYHRLPSPETSRTSDTSPECQSPTEASQSSSQWNRFNILATSCLAESSKSPVESMSLRKQYQREPNSPPYQTNDQCKPSLPPLKAVLGNTIASPPTTPTMEPASAQPLPREPRLMSATYMPPALYGHNKGRGDPFLKTHMHSRQSSRGAEVVSTLQPRQAQTPSYAYEHEPRSVKRISMSHRQPFSRPLSPLPSPRSSTMSAPNRRLHDLSVNAGVVKRTASMPNAPSKLIVGHYRNTSPCGNPDSAHTPTGPHRPWDMPVGQPLGPPSYASTPTAAPPASDGWRYACEASNMHSMASDQMHHHLKQTSPIGSGMQSRGQPPFFLPSHYDPQHGKARRRSNLPKQSTEIMKTWFDQNIHNPYPSEEQKAYFSNATGISMTQVSNWFINHRRRCPELRDRRDRNRTGEMDMAS